MPWKDELGFWHWGRWDFLLHDNGWFVARDMVVKFNGRWPKHQGRKVLQTQKPE